jgi:GH15 family glucan-1,4-alpha-glucosidase
MVVKDSPTRGPLLHDQREWAAGRDNAAAREHEAGGDQREARAQVANLNLLEPKAVPAGSRGEAWSIVLSDELEAVARSAPIDECRRALSRVVREETCQVAAVPVIRGAIELARDLAGQGNDTRVASRRRGPAAGPASRNGGNQKERHGTHGRPVEKVLEGGHVRLAMQDPAHSAYTWAMTDVQDQTPTEAPARRSGAARHQPISAYGLIGDMRTAALIGLDGSIDWCCLPRFDSASVFAAILDTERGGTWAIHPEGRWTSTQRYLPRTNILETIFRTADEAVISVTDFMPVAEDGRPSGPHPEIHRRLRCNRGRALMSMVFMPRFEYGARTTRLEVLRAGLFATDRTDQVLTLSSGKPFEWMIEQSIATARFGLEKGEERWLVLRYDDDDIHPVDRYESARKLDNTAAFWQKWSSKVRYRGSYRGMVKRSALALKLLTHAETGAMIAAPTTSLPETIGGVRNWDYRFVWLRDAAFTLEALDAVGHYHEADQFMRFLKKVCRHEGGGHLQIMYGIDGRRDLVERQLDHLSGYRNSRPVRVGNGAVGQLQLDVYGEVMETADIWRRNHEMTEGTWRVLRGLVDWVSKNWPLPDSSIWEVRGEVRHYVFSKVMTWVALDRGVRMAEELSLEGDTAGWRAARDALHAEIMERGWSEERQSFVQSYGDTSLDAAALAIPMVRFLPWNHPRVHATVRAIARELTTMDGELVYRYRHPDGLEGEEGAFSICTFWLAQALAMIGERERAERVFRRMLRHANHVGLYSEEIDPLTGEFLGNFPQAFTHIALINCAAALARLEKRS